ncbi:hypothetical protein BU23DRAFT_564332 [Bimuria novae-zelandiae CBS 107.79]|uniref:Uncharacterized protein n=1 Tax=Bimuria novae-zelandiae CBS 107.79 TaxID=1447943 RepID=A0A6A5VY15_9PLEO|nr:hypothetical protein BU23DRAFT_564332 [Bimuria novae-zelandiae CBS 107.79]
MAKAYFFSAFLASATGKRKLDVINDSIVSAPGSSTSNLEAWEVLKAFSAETTHVLSPEMLSVDMVAPRRARFKVYFRSQATDFDTVTKIMSLNGRLSGNNIHVGKERLRVFWQQLLNHSKDTPLPDIRHRTAGILYYADFRLSDRLPSVKNYIPVRHYCASDKSVMIALSVFMDTEGHRDRVDKYNSVLIETL